MRLAHGDTTERHAFGVLVRDRDGDPVVLAVTDPGASRPGDRGTAIPRSAVPLVLDGLDPRLVCDLLHVGDMIDTGEVPPADAETIRRALWDAVVGAPSRRVARLRSALARAGVVVARVAGPELDEADAAPDGPRPTPSRPGWLAADFGVVVDGGDGHPAWLLVADPGAPDREKTVGMTRWYAPPPVAAPPAGVPGTVVGGVAGAVLGAVAGVVGAACGLGPVALVAAPLLGAVTAVWLRRPSKDQDGSPPAIPRGVEDVRRLDVRHLPVEARIDLAHVAELLARRSVSPAVSVETHELLWAMADPSADERRREAALRRASTIVEGGLTGGPTGVLLAGAAGRVEVDAPALRPTPPAAEWVSPPPRGRTS